MILQRLYARCWICGLLVTWIDDGEPIHPYLVDLGYKRYVHTQAIHGKCANKEFGWSKEEYEKR